VWLLLAVSALAPLSCGDSDSAVRLGGPCQRTSDCLGSDQGSAACLKGICEPPDGGEASDANNGLGD
jgi:hypothetical protein